MAGSEKFQAAMNETMTIHIDAWRCRAFHGVYPQEPKVGGEFELTLEVSFVIDERIQDLAKTISYVDLLCILRRQMRNTRPLLETVAMDAATEIKQSYPGVVEIILSIHKLQAPIEGFQGRVGVCYHKKYDT
jgi:7,8-dihydroneopterin aldolase/epimerase/oxygenase